MIYQQVNFNDFVTAFEKAGRKDQFSLEGLRILYDYLEELFYHVGQDLELDVIGLCCQYTDYTKEEFLNDYSIDGIDCIDSLEQALIDGDIDGVIDYHLGKDVILVDNDY